jgi:hypothetical protein
MMGQQNGYTCATCGMWVYYGTTHMCGGSPGLSNLPGGTLNLPACRAPFNPINAEMIRLIIREELERHFSKDSQSQRVSEVPK